MTATRSAIVLLLLSLASASSMAGISVHCLGNGQAVYLIGGGPAFTTWNLVPVQQRLSDRYQVCRWDMRGVGDNAALTLRDDRPVLSQWLHDMAEVLPEEPVILWGHSWGALQSLLFAKHYPHRVRAIVLSNPVDPALDSLEYIERKRYVHPYVESHLGLEDIDTPTERRHRFRSKIASYFMDAETGWSYAAQFDHDDSNDSLNVQVWQEYRTRPLQRGDFEPLSVKLIRLIYCKHDVLMPESFTGYAKLIPPDRHYILDGCSHFPWVESPNSYYEVLLQALDEASL